jgi:sarcosine oxidase, subunit alpha
MASIQFEGRSIPALDGDTVAAALHRAGVDILSRSFKYHRPRGLYCLTGDCANCLVKVNDEPAVRSCVTPADDGLQVSRENAWPSVDRDALAIFWHVRALLPVGFYYKTFVRPLWVWPLVERYIRRIAGIGRIDLHSTPAHRERRHHHPDVCVIGGGVAGLAAAQACAEQGETVVLVDEGTIGDKIAPGPTRSAIAQLQRALVAQRGVTLLERTSASGVYDGPLVTAAGPDFMHLIHPNRIIVATGAIERHAVFPGSDLPGVWLGRGAARMAGVHGLKPGQAAVVVAATMESLEHLEVLRASGVEIRRVVAPAAVAARAPSGLPILINGEVVAALGRRHVNAVIVKHDGQRDKIPCDSLVLSLGYTPRDGMLRQAVHCTVDGAGDVVLPGGSVDSAILSGRNAARQAPAVAPPEPNALPPSPTAGIVCTCEDVGATELADAWREGFRSTELLKRYTTATMGPCQGVLCHAHLRAFVRERAPSTLAAAPTTARPPARGLTLEDAAAGVRGEFEWRTGLHDRHVALGARMEWAGAWKRAASYGDANAEYWAVRKGASVMDVGTLGKFRVLGPDAREFLDRLCPSTITTLRPGKSRYTLYLNEAGYIFDDGMVGALADNEYYVTATSSGAESAEAWMRDWVETWNLKVHIVNQTAGLGAINLTGPRAREVLARVTSDPIDGKSLPYAGLRRMQVSGIPCLVLRVGFTGELSFELHHPRSRGGELWDLLLRAGADLGIVPHGLDTLKLLRLEKGHILIGQDTDFDTTPRKLGLDWVVSADKRDFVGKTALARLNAFPLQRRLAPIKFTGPVAPDEGAQLLVGSERIGWVTSSRYSPTFENSVALGWLNATNGTFPTEVVAISRGQRRTSGVVGSGPFYDPHGERLRA